MKAAFWRNTWWHLRHPADAAPYQPVERRVVTAEEAAGLGLVEGAKCPPHPAQGMHTSCWNDTWRETHGNPPVTNPLAALDAHQPTCDASDTFELLGQERMWGPCVLRAGHHGPVHKNADGTSWAKNERPFAKAREAIRQARGDEAAPQVPVMFGPCGVATPPDTAEEHDAITGPLTSALGGDRSARIIAHTLGSHGYNLDAVATMSDAELLAVPGIGETSLKRIRAHVPGASSDCEWDGFTRCPHCRNCVLDLDIDQHLTACREAPVSVAGELLHCTCCCPESTHTGPGGHCVMPGCREEPCTPMSEWRAQQAAEYEEEPVPVPRDALRRLVEVAMWVSRGRSMAFIPDDSEALGKAYPDAKARFALGALDDAGLLDQFREDGDG